jgi:hypothetical protein
MSEKSRNHGNCSGHLDDDPPRPSTTHEAAMEFASGDPFVASGVVSGRQVREWREVTPG